MRMVKPDDIEAACARLASPIDVILRVDFKSRRTRGDISCASRFDDRFSAPEQEAAAFRRRSLARVRDDLLDRRAGNRHRDSIAIAIPIPPPMHSDATPYRSFRARSA